MLPGSFGTYRVDDEKLWPNSESGKVYGVDRFGRFSCSATVVTSKLKSVIMTAGHCVRYSRSAGWVRHLIFVPAYRAGRRPYGTWVARSAAVPGEWFSRQDESFDYAAVALRRRRGRALQGVVGSAGLTWNRRRLDDYRAFGYPQNFVHASRMIACHSRFARSDPYYVRHEPRSIGIRCRMHQGASGGGWLTPDNEVSSVTTHLYPRRSRSLLYGPFFTRKVVGVLHKAQR